MGEKKDNYSIHFATAPLTPTEISVAKLAKISRISDHQQSWRYEKGPSKGPGPRSAGDL